MKQEATKPPRYVCIHGHFYQPPRESPWLDIIEVQDSAHPFHDWNERITAECYGPNAAARILGPDGRIRRLVNNYSRISFNFGPTLLSWLEEKLPAVYRAILDGDREGRERFGGHGPAIAQVYNHVIMPLASPADKRLQVLWGARDFQHRFGRPAEGMWLAETAVDIATLEALADHNVRFTILAPRQAKRARPLGSKEWHDVTGDKIDPSRAYLQKLPSGRQIALFFYDGPVSRAVAFEGLLNDGAKFVQRISHAFDEHRMGAQLAHIATDGESYGHHHAHGDMALAAALAIVEESHTVKLTCYGQFLALHPPEFEVDVLENTAWSCAHGIERWRSDCGCNSGRPGWNQKWRGPLRRALDSLRDATRPLYQREAYLLLKDPWRAFDDYVEVLLAGGARPVIEPQTPAGSRHPLAVGAHAARERYLDSHARRRLLPNERVRAWELLELMRNAQLMYTSCGWFFDEISGLETAQVMLYAARVIQLSGKLFSLDLEKSFLAALEQAPSNIPHYTSGREVYLRLVKPAAVEPYHVGAHYAVSSLFEDYPATSHLFCYQINRHDVRSFESGKVRMAAGHATQASLQTEEPWHFVYAAVHFGDHNVTGGVAPYSGEAGYHALLAELGTAFSRSDNVELLRLVDRHLPLGSHSLASLFRDEQRKVLKECLRASLGDTMELYGRIFAQSQPLMRFLRHLSAPVPMPLRAAAEVLFNADALWAFSDDDPDGEQVRRLVREAAEWGMPLDTGALSFRYSQMLDRAAERWHEAPAVLSNLQALVSAIEMARELPFKPNLWNPQNVVFEMLDGEASMQLLKAAQCDEARLWVDRFLQLGRLLGVDVDEQQKARDQIKEPARLADLVAEVARQRRVPRATYRLQVHAGQPLMQVAELLDYLADLGVSDLYLSPILQARPGSQHGYDCCNHEDINPEIGGMPALKALSAALAARGMGAILDVVPNHMGIGHSTNRWWVDVLENGQSSRYADYFDIDWSPVNPDLAGKVLLPVLGEQYGQALEAGRLRLAYHEGEFSLRYHEHQFPIAPRTYREVLASQYDELSRRLGPDHEHAREYESLLWGLSKLPPRTGFSPEERDARYRETAIIQRRLRTLTATSPEARDAVAAAVRLYNGELGRPDSFTHLDHLIGEQAYRLAYWQVAADEINYRRFFDINDLAAIRTERAEVFEAAHRVPFRLLAAGHIHGLRIDHPDGLYSPARYFRLLQSAYLRARLHGRWPGTPSEEELQAALDDNAREGRPWPLYVLAEKILGEGEPLPRDWAIDGTTGYDFLNLLGGLFVPPQGLDALDGDWAAFVGQPTPFDAIVRQSKTRIMEGAMASEMASLAHRLDRLAERTRRYRDFTLSALAHALREFVASLTVYRTYTEPDGQASARDRGFLEQAAREAKLANPNVADALFDFIRDTALLDNVNDFPERDRHAVREWAMRLQQITGPIMAKGIEDTAFYRYNRLVSLSEVGGHPHAPCISITRWHQENAARAVHWPNAMLSTSTHDTKRGEDTRARISTLAELPNEWEEAVTEWRWMHASLLREVDGQPAPSAGDQYLFYQTLLGVWPDLPPDDDELAALSERLSVYMAKATKEAKLRTSWINPDEAYDDAVRAFVEGAMADEGLADQAGERGDVSSPHGGHETPFSRSFLALHRKVAYFGRLSALAQVLLKFTSPGVPDIYQGAELWTLSLVDPDNRRPVDWPLRRALLAQVKDARPADLLASAADGRIKLWLTSRLLGHRAKHADIYRGAYEPAEASGEQAHAICAFVRRVGDRWLLSAACIRPVRVAGGEQRLPVGALWGNTFIPAPRAVAKGEVVEVLTGERVPLRERDGKVGVLASELFASLPFALLGG
jgi:(1->4)-alpha-D-glucan 1-alpha-D-glucosylmutase